MIWGLVGRVFPVCIRPYEMGATEVQLPGLRVQGAVPSYRGAEGQKFVAFSLTR